jgi:hypothetical protein
LTDREIYRDLSKLIRGELATSELKRLARREGFKTFSELCASRLPEDLGRVRVSPRDVLGRIERFRRGAIDLRELWSWADEVYNISFNHRIAYEPRSEELVTAALSALSVVANGRLFPNLRKTARGLEYLRACLMRRRKIQLRNLFMRAFEDLERVHLKTRLLETGAAEAGVEEEAPRWADVVLLDRPFEAGGELSEYGWVIAFTVTARSLYEEERAHDEALEAGKLPDGWICPQCEREQRRQEEASGDEATPRFDLPDWRAENESESEEPRAAPAPPRPRPTPRDGGEDVDRIRAIRRLVPNFATAEHNPSYLHDGDGIAEVVLDAEHIGPAEVRYAAKLFCIANRIREASLDGEPVKTLVVKPGTGRRTPGR